MADKDLKLGLRLDVTASGTEKLDRTADAVEQIGDEAAQATVQAAQLARATQQVGDAGAAGLDAAAEACPPRLTSPTQRYRLSTSPPPRGLFR